MQQYIDFLKPWAEWFVVLTIFSVVTVVVAIPIGTRFVAKLPPDYFLSRQRGTGPTAQSRMVRWLLLPAKNVLGAILILAGVVMLFVPGQGLLTILVGLVLTDFPGKFTMERWLVRRPQVRRSIDWLRRRAGEPPLQLDDP